MMEKLSAQTIQEMFKNIDDKLNLIHEQTTKTNGRVSSIESWKNFADGAIKVTVTVVLPILFYLLYLHIK